MSRTCRTPGQHRTDEPTDYGPWLVWAADLYRTHDQRRCPGCGRFALWVPRDGTPAPASGDG